MTPGGFPAGQLRRIVEAAGKRGLRVMAHANGAGAIRDAAESGVCSIEHGFFMSDRALSVMRASGAFWVPTVGALTRMAQAPHAATAVRSFIERTIRDHLDALGRAFSLGVPLAIGTDCVLPDPLYEERYQDELAFFRSAGIPVDDVERIATQGGARLLGI